MVEVEIGPALREPRRVGEAGGGVFRGVARDRERLVDGGANRVVGEIGGARVAAPLADVHGDADALVAVVRDGLDLVLAHRHALADALRDFGLGGGRAAALRARRARLRRCARARRSRRESARGVRGMRGASSGRGGGGSEGHRDWRQSRCDGIPGAVREAGAVIIAKGPRRDAASAAHSRHETTSRRTRRPASDPRQAEVRPRPAAKHADARPAGPGRGAGRARPRAARRSSTCPSAWSTRSSRRGRSRAHEGRRRQMQYIGKLMRDIDPGPVREAIERFAAGRAFRPRRVRRGRALARGHARDDDAVARFAAEHPAADAAALASLVRDARAERSRGGPPHRYRELFRAKHPAGGAMKPRRTRRTLLIGLVSISDRASAGVYEDKGLPGLNEWFAAALASPYRMIQRLIPDEQPVIERTLVELVRHRRLPPRADDGRDGSGAARRDAGSHARRRAQGDARIRRADAAGEPASTCRPRSCRARSASFAAAR